MSCTLVVVVGGCAVEFQQSLIEPLALGDEARMLVAKLAKAVRRSVELVLRSVVAFRARDIAPGAFQLDLGAAARAFVPELHLVVADDALDQLVPGDHAIMGLL